MWTRILNGCKRFVRAERGATLIEFALLAPLFFGLIGATMETAVVYFAGQSLDAAIEHNARLARTGQAQSMDADDYRAALCGQLYGIFDCDAIHISLHPIDSFADFARDNPMDQTSGAMTGEELFDPGSGSTLMAIEAYYKWPTIINVPGLMVGLTPDGKRLLSAASVFRNEPFKG